MLFGQPGKPNGVFEVTPEEMSQLLRDSEKLDSCYREVIVMDSVLMDKDVLIGALNVAIAGKDSALLESRAIIRNIDAEVAEWESVVKAAEAQAKQEKKKRRRMLVIVAPASALGGAAAWELIR